jgi:hypothetical protein
VVRIVLLALVLSISGLCSDWTSLYGRDKLESRRSGLSHDVDKVIAQEITPFLTLEQAHAFSKIQLDLPVSVAPDPNPLDSFVVGDNHIVIPLLTVAFIEDMSEAYAWLWANHYSSKTVDEYMGMLRERLPSDFASGQYPNPLEALHIHVNALEDPAVAKMAQRVRGTTLSFLLLHQFGHLSYVPSAEEGALKHDRVEAGEERADAIALEVMKKNSETPAGLLMLIHGMMYLPTVAPKNHPLSEVRLKAISDYLDSHVREFSEGRPDRRLARVAIEALAGHIRQAERYLSDTTGQELWAAERRRTTIADLAPRQLGQGQ